MPKYKYYCETCEEVFTKEKKMEDEHPTVCPSCGGRLHRIYGKPEIGFKGTDYYCKAK